MGVNCQRMEAARRLMLRAQADLREYEVRLKSGSPDPKRFRRLYLRAQVCSEEYLSLLDSHFREKYLRPKSA